MRFNPLEDFSCAIDRGDQEVISNVVTASVYISS